MHAYLDRGSPIMQTVQYSTSLGTTDEQKDLVQIYVSDKTDRRSLSQSESKRSDRRSWADQKKSW